MSTVILPAHPFTALRRERVFLTARPGATRMQIPRTILARRARSSVGRVPRDESSFVEAGNQGWALASIALMCIVVMLACLVTGLV